MPHSVKGPRLSETDSDKGALRSFSMVVSRSEEILVSGRLANAYVRRSDTRGHLRQAGTARHGESSNEATAALSRKDSRPTRFYPLLFLPSFLFSRPFFDYFSLKSVASPRPDAYATKNRKRGKRGQAELPPIP